MSKGEIVKDVSFNGETELEVVVENESVWLNQTQIACLFGVKQPAISKHIRNVYNSSELKENSTYSILEYMGNDGQVFDAYNLVSDIVRSAKKSIVLIDNFIDDTVLTLFSKRKKGVTIKILTKKLDEKKILDVKKFNEQFPPAEIVKFEKNRLQSQKNKGISGFFAVDKWISETILISA